MLSWQFAFIVFVCCSRLRLLGSLCWFPQTQLYAPRLCLSLASTVHAVTQEKAEMGWCSGESTSSLFCLFVSHIVSPFTMFRYQRIALKPVAQRNGKVLHAWCFVVRLQSGAMSSTRSYHLYSADLQHSDFIASGFWTGADISANADICTACSFNLVTWISNYSKTRFVSPWCWCVSMNPVRGPRVWWQN